MNRYTIHCTPEQTKKALGLGAPIFHTFPNMTMKGEGWFQDKTFSYLCPTAEQMLGWLEELGVFVSVLYGYGVSYKWAFDLDGEEYIDYKSGEFNSRKEAILAAIDATLEYLHRKAMEGKK